MIRRPRLVAALALWAELNSAGAALVQAQTEAGGAPPASAPDPSSTQSTALWVPKTDFKPWDPNANAPTYSVTPPSGSSGIYLPAAVLGYAKSAAGCVVIGCDNGPQVGGPSGPPSSGRAEPLPSDPGLFDRH